MDLEIKIAKLKMSKIHKKNDLAFPRMKRMHQVMSSQGMLQKHPVIKGKYSKK